MSSERYERGTYIGGHEMSAIAGMNPYMTIADVYANIALGLREDISNEPQIRRGLIIEPGFIDWLEGEWGITLERDFFLKDPDIPYFGGTMDGIQRDVDDNGNEIKIIHEMTSTTTRTLHLWTEEEPAKYKWIQCQYYMGLADAHHGWIHLFVADTGDIRHYRVDRKDGAIDAFREEAEEFWLNHIMTNIPPDIDASTYPGDVADEMMKRLYPEGSRGDMTADERLVNLAHDYDIARDAHKDAEAKKKSIAAQIKSELGSHEKAMFNGGYVSWKNSRERTSTNWESMARNLMQSLPEDERAKAIRNFTKTSPGARSLRVQLNKDKTK